MGSNMKILMKIGIFLLFLFFKSRLDCQVNICLPKEIYICSYNQLSVFLYNTIFTRYQGGVTFNVSCDVGYYDIDQWYLSPIKSQVGKHELNISVSDSNGFMIDSQNSIINVIDENIGYKDSLKILFIGNSLTQMAVFPARVMDLLRRSGNINFVFLGSIGGGNMPRHEGYGGKTWRWFCSDSTSPFVFKTGDQYSLNFSRYFNETLHGEKPNIIIIELGINDCTHINSTSSKTIDTGIDIMFHYAGIFLNSLISFLPDVNIGICLPPAPNNNADAFYKNYGDSLTQWDWHKIQHRLTQRYIDYFTLNYKENCSIIPDNLSIDTINGYPNNNALHPNADGYRQIGDCIYYWIKWRLSNGLRYLSGIKTIPSNSIGFYLWQNYPNPFNNSTIITYSLERSCWASMYIYNSNGQIVKQIFNNFQFAGEHTIRLNAEELNNGMYIYKLISENKIQSQKMLLLK